MGIQPTTTPHTPPSAGQWPREPGQLTDGRRCPACFTLLHGQSCPGCGLELAGPAAAEVFHLGTAIAHTESRRQHVIRTMRSAQQAREWARVTSPPVRPADRPAGDWPAPAGSPATSSDCRESDQPRRPRRSGVQVLLLTVGVALVSVTAIFFLLLAYLIASLEARSALTAGASVLVLALAHWLRRRNLPGTAEGVGGVALVLLVLDLVVIRWNHLFGSATLDGWTFAGVSQVGLAALLVGLHRVSGLRVLSAGTAVLLPAGGFALGLGLAPGTGDLTSVWVAGLGAALATSSWRLLERGSAPRRLSLPRPELGALQVFGMLGLTVASLSAVWSLTAYAWGGLTALTVAAAGWALHLAVAARGRPATDAGRLVLAVGLGATAGGVGLGVVDTLTPAAALAATTPLGALAAVLLAGWARSGSAVRRAAATTAVVVAALTTLWPLATTGLDLLWRFGDLLGTGPLGRNESLLVGERLAAPTSLLGTAVLITVALGLLRARRLAWLPVALAGPGLVAAALSPAVPLWSMIIAAGTAALVVTALLRWPTWGRALPEVAVGTLAAVVGLAGTVLVVGSTSAVLWFPALVLASTLMIMTRVAASRLVRPGLARTVAPTVTGIACVVGLTGTVLLDGVLADLVPTVPSSIPLGPVLGGSVLLTATAALHRRLPRVDRWVAAGSGLTAVVVAGAGLVTAPATVAGVGLTAVVLASVGWHRRVLPGPERCLAGVVGPVAAGFAANAWAAVVRPDADLTSPVLAVVTLVTAALAGWLCRADAVPPRRRSVSARLGWDVAVGLLSLGTVVTLTDHLDWFSLLVLAVAMIALASAADDLITGDSRRRHLAWLALTLAAAALWSVLVERDVRVVEAYTLPVAVSLVIIVALVAARRPDGPQQHGRLLVLGAALVVGLLPSAAASAVGSPLRPALLIIIGTGLVTVAALDAPRTARLPRHTRTVLAVGGTLTAVLTGIVRSGGDLASAADVTAARDWEFWAAAAGTGLLLAGGIHLLRHPRARSWTHLGVGLGLLLVPAWVADLADPELWSVVALGAISLAVLLAGLALRWQAPVLAGAVVLVGHAIAQLWPWIADVYGALPWWLWAGIGGVVLIILAATYERRVRDLKAVALGVSSLR